MGTGASTLAIHGRIDAVLPHFTFDLAQTAHERNELTTKIAPVFPGGHTDRTQFVHSIRILLSSNGRLPLGDKRFKLVFSRAPQEFHVANDDDDSGAQIFVSIVAVDAQGSLAAKIVSERAGNNKVEAFQMFRKTVEMHMHKMLDTVPGVGESAGPSTTAAAAAVFERERNVSADTLASTVLPDEPPTYQEANK